MPTSEKTETIEKKKPKDVDITELSRKWLARVLPEPVSITRVSREFVTGTHPFCITPNHVAHASDHHGGILDEQSLRTAPCGFKDCRESFDHPCHQPQVTALVRLSRECTQAEVVTILKGIMDEVTADGIDGFAFPDFGKITDVKHGPASHPTSQK